MNSRIRRFAAVVLTAVVALAATPIFAADAPSGVVNINTASVEQLALLPGVGPALAARILEHRQKNNGFQKAEDLLLVRGIGEKSFERMKSYVATSGATTLAADVPSPRTKTAAPKSAGKSQS